MQRPEGTSSIIFNALIILEIESQTEIIESRGGGRFPLGKVYQRLEYVITIVTSESMNRTASDFLVN